MNPSDYCQNSPYLATSCYEMGLHAGSTAPAVASARYDWGVGEGDFPSGSDISHTWVDPAAAPAPPVKIAENGQLGTTWGQAWNRQTDTLRLGAYTKATTDYGPNGPGAIYGVPTDPATGASTGAPALFADLAALGYDVCDNPHGPDLVDPSGTTAPQLHDPVIEAVGKCGIGDMDLRWDSSTLYVMNLTSREVVQLDATTGADQGSWAFPLDQDTLPADDGYCANPATDIRPFALEEHDGNVYVGAMCTAESTGDREDLWVYVYEVDPATGVFTLVLDYSFDLETENQGFAPANAWVTDQATIIANAQFGDQGQTAFAYHSQPMLTDIEFWNNDLVLGFRDRFSDQGGDRIPMAWPGASQPTTLVTFAGGGSGDITCGPYDNATGTWSIETGNTCGDRISADPPAGENEEFYADGGSIGHSESALGGLELIPGHTLAFTITNPSELLESNRRIFNSASFGYVDNLDSSVTRGYILYGPAALDPNNDGSQNPLGKAGGLGDVEALCEEAPV